jgi:hypothetical protein
MSVTSQSKKNEGVVKGFQTSILLCSVFSVEDGFNVSLLHCIMPWRNRVSIFKISILQQLLSMGCIQPPTEQKCCVTRKIGVDGEGGYILP